jgi:hypothetical protein
MKSRVIVLGVAVVACIAFAGNAFAQAKGAGKSSITIVKVPAPAAASPTPKTAGSVSSKAAATVPGKPPTGGGSFAIKLAKELGDPAKPGFADGEYVLEIESAGTPTGNVVDDPLAAAYFITLTVAGQKCTLHSLAAVDPAVATCGVGPNPACAAPEGVGKCAATIYQVAGNQLAAAGLVANQPFGARFRIRTNPTPANCKTGDLFVEGLGFLPPGTSCRSGAVVGVGGVALGSTQ